MQTPSALELLGVWERGLAERPLERALSLLALACPDASRDALADLSIGQRDRLLLTLREATFGPEMTGLLTCPPCGEALQTSFTTIDLRAEGADEPAAPFGIRLAGCDVELRVLTSRDLAMAQATEAAQARSLLLERCVVAATLEGKPAKVDELPVHVVDAAVERIAAMDPMADMQLALRCPACGHHWHVPFDILSFFWTELEAWSAKVLQEVHVLASAYGWSERDILSLGRLRRRHYLDMVEAWPIS
jgi:hypothetical protein